MIDQDRLQMAALAVCQSMHGNPLYLSEYYIKHARAAISAYLGDDMVVVPAKPIGWFNPWNDYHGFQQVAQEFEGGDGLYPFYAEQKAHDDLSAAACGAALSAELTERDGG